MGSLPTRFWVTTGIGIHSEHQINAYDGALYAAGISEQNIIAVSSVPPVEQIFPKIINGLTYVPAKMLTSEESKHYADNFEKYEVDIEKYKYVLPKRYFFKPIHLPRDAKPYYALENSWCINVVLARSDADQFERMTASVGLGWYKTQTGYGIYAVEDHGDKSADGSIDNCVEMLDRMMAFRHVEPIDDVLTVPQKKISKSTELISLLGCCDDEKKYSGVRVSYTTQEPKRRIYTVSMDAVPEGYVGTSIAVIVFDPFTEVHS